METCALLNGWFFIPFVTFANNHVYVCVWLPECGNFFYCGVVRFQPLAGPDRGPFFCCGLVGLQPLAGTYSIIFAQFFDSKCAYVPGSIHISNFDHNSWSPRPISGKPKFPQGETDIEAPCTRRHSATTREPYILDLNIPHQKRLSTFSKLRL